MATNPVQTFQQPHVMAAINVDPRQQTTGSPALLQLPIEILKEIGEYVATSNANNKVEAATNAVNFGKTCVATHVITHSANIDKVIEEGAKSKTKWVEDANDPWKMNLINVLTGQVLSSHRINIHI